MTITKAEYERKSANYRSIFQNLGNWKGYDKYIGRKTMLHYDNGTVLLIEGLNFKII